MAGSEFHGVNWSVKIGRWLALMPIGFRGKAFFVIAQFDDERTAAMYRDRVVRHYFDDGAESLNFPDELTSPLDLKTARKMARALWKEQQTSSRYRGVSRLGPNRWQSHITPNKEAVSLGVWDDEVLAGRAYDRGARYFGVPTSLLNFPDEDLPATPPTVLAHEAQAVKRMRKASRFLGVTWFKARGKWVAKIAWRNAGAMVHRTIGYFDSEEEAAFARDRVAREMNGIYTKLNFHPLTGEPVYGLKFTPELLDDTAPRQTFTVRWKLEE